jgi:hypothetical protein
MNRWRVEVALALMLILATSIAEGRWRRAAVQVRSWPSVASGGSLRVTQVDPDSLAATADRLVAKDPFRIGGGSRSVRLAIAAAAPAPARAPRPVLTLKAIVGGPPWQAIITGIPGQGGETVVGAGARFESFLVQSISRDTLVIVGADTTWKLTLHRTTP